MDFGWSLAFGHPSETVKILITVRVIFLISPLKRISAAKAGIVNEDKIEKTLSQEISTGLIPLVGHGDLLPRFL